MAKTEKKVATLKEIWGAIENADRAVQAYLVLDPSGAGEIAIAALTHPMKGFQGIVEAKIFDLDPSALD